VSKKGGDPISVLLRSTSVAALRERAVAAAESIADLRFERKLSTESIRAPTSFSSACRTTPSIAGATETPND